MKSYKFYYLVPQPGPKIYIETNKMLKSNVAKLRLHYAGTKPKDVNVLEYPNKDTLPKIKEKYIDDLYKIQFLPYKTTSGTVIEYDGEVFQQLEEV